MTAWTEPELRSLDHNDHRRAFLRYLRGERHAMDKQDFLLKWIAPAEGDFVLECGCSGGKTCVDLARRGGCRTLGIDFDPEAVAIARQMRDEHFPHLKDRCRFDVGDLAEMPFDAGITKVVLADFTEHVPDEVLERILANIRRQLPGVRLYVYTPVRSHLFERMKHRNFILRSRSGHINVKTEAQLTGFLESRGWRVQEHRWRPSHLPVVNVAERLLGRLPWVGTLFRRRMAVLAVPAND